MPTQTFSIPEIISGKYTGKFVSITVDDKCYVCKSARGPVKSVSNAKYVGTIKRAKCPKDCETYEGLLAYSKQFPVKPSVGSGLRLDGIDLAAPVKRVVKTVGTLTEDQLRSILTRPTHPENCSKCGAPKATCKYHRNA